MSERKHPKKMERRINRTKIYSLIAEGPKTWKELIEGTGLSKSVLASHLQELEDDGLIISEIDPKDRRVKIYKINPEAMEVSEKLMSVLLSYFIGKNFKDVKELRESIGEVSLICMAGGDEGLRVLNMVLKNLAEILQELNPKVGEEYRKKFEELKKPVQNYAKKVIYRKKGDITDKELTGELLADLAVIGALSLLKSRQSDI
ncbi:MarR family transcriptional regulator [Geoglobus acetivorans]|uniref:Winged helix-turn-helix domain-containing protein n=1 Tax=Geoglobus acetivorans TaxID=565033 RepID=A0ABZ3H2V3_GEOAI|nr:winged helix-turn-helix transcriptional regulator [Geoglobus acetivorans]